MIRVIGNFTNRSLLDEASWSRQAPHDFDTIQRKYILKHHSILRGGYNSYLPAIGEADPKIPNLTLGSWKVEERDDNYFPTMTGNYFGRISGASENYYEELFTEVMQITIAIRVVDFSGNTSWTNASASGTFNFVRRKEYSTSKDFTTYSYNLNPPTMQSNIIVPWPTGASRVCTFNDIVSNVATHAVISGTAKKVGSLWEREIVIGRIYHGDFVQGRSISINSPPGVSS